jgi:hypothetical protein
MMLGAVAGLAAGAALEPALAGVMAVARLRTGMSSKAAAAQPVSEADGFMRMGILSQQ